MMSSKVRSDPRPAVTDAQPGAMCDTELAVTHADLIPAQVRPFTCTFPGDLIAVVYVVGGTDEQARQELRNAFVPGNKCTVEPGDPTNGHAEPFYLWVCQSPQQPQDQKRNKGVLRNATAEGEKEAATLCP